MEQESGYIVGFRAWKVVKKRKGKIYLKAWNKNVLWKPNDHTAQCHRHLFYRLYLKLRKRNHTPADKSCECGFYAWHVLELYKKRIPRDIIVGAVLGWGKVQIHPEGWRAQYCKPIAFINSSNRHLKKAAKQYGVPIFAKPALETYALEFGQRWQGEIKVYTDPPRHIQKLLSVVSALMIFWVVIGHQLIEGLNLHIGPFKSQGFAVLITSILVFTLVFLVVKSLNYQRTWHPNESS